MNDSTVRPVFLEKNNYRRRRMMDAARLLPIFGAVAFAVPLLWPAPADAPQPGGMDPVSMSEAILYVFGVWLLLIVLAAVFGLRVRRWADGLQEKNGRR